MHYHTIWGAWRGHRQPKLLLVPNSSWKTREKMMVYHVYIYLFLVSSESWSLLSLCSSAQWLLNTLPSVYKAVIVNFLAGLKQLQLQRPFTGWLVGWLVGRFFFFFFFFEILSLCSPGYPEKRCAPPCLAFNWQFGGGRGRCIMNVLLEWVFVLCACLVPSEVRRKHKMPWNCTVDSHKLPCSCWEPNPDPL